MAADADATSWERTSSAFPGQPVTPDLSRVHVRELLQLEDMIIAELRDRGLVRTNNKPLGDIAEQVVRLARGGTLAPNSTRSHDIIDHDGHRIQVKAMGGQHPGRSGVFSPFRSFDFDSAVFLVFEAGTFDILLAREAGPAEVRSTARYSPHTNGRLATLHQVKGMGVDVTDEMRAAYGALDDGSAELREGLRAGRTEEDVVAGR